jgi:hypothetical protein
MQILQRKLWAISLLFIVASLMLPTSVPAQKRATVPPVTALRQIDIIASWGGLGPAEYAHAVIQRSGNQFVVDDQPVETDKVEALMAALFAEPQKEPSPDLIARQVRDYNIDYFATDGLRRCAGDDADLNQPRILFRRLFNDPENQRRWLIAAYSPQNFHTDDYPAEKVTVTFEDGSTVTASSRSQQTLMLPF